MAHLPTQVCSNNAVAAELIEKQDSADSWREELPDEWKPSLRPQPTRDSASPAPPPGPRWIGDRGAIPGEPTYFLDGDLESASAAITPCEGRWGGILFDVTLANGEVVGMYDDLEIAARAAEYATKVLRGEVGNEDLRSSFCFPREDHHDARSRSVPNEQSERERTNQRLMGFH
jgi:hypothetical protein